MPHTIQQPAYEQKTDFDLAIDAARRDDVGSLQKLAQRVANLSSSGDEASRLLITAASHRSLRALEFMATRANINAVDRQGVSALAYAIRVNSAEGVSILLEHGADPRHKAGLNAPPLLLAIEMGSTRMVEMLLAAGASPKEDVNRFNETALMLAASSISREDSMTRFNMILPLSDPLAVSSSGRNALSFAIHPHGRERLRLLILAGALPHALDEGGASAIGLARAWGQPEMAEIMERTWAQKERADLDAISTLKPARHRAPRV